MPSDYSKYFESSNSIVSEVITSHLLIENYLRRQLSVVLKVPDALINDQGPKFALLVNLAEALGIVAPDLAKVLRKVNTVRNRYAHRLCFEASMAQVDEVLSAMREMKSPFYVSLMQGSEHELVVALSALTDWFQLQYGPL